LTVESRSNQLAPAESVRVNSGPRQIVS
jgi:hypothetical protein